MIEPARAEGFDHGNKQFAIFPESGAAETHGHLLCCRFRNSPQELLQSCRRVSCLHRLVDEFRQPVFHRYSRAQALSRSRPLRLNVIQHFDRSLHRWIHPALSGLLRQPHECRAHQALQF